MNETQKEIYEALKDLDSETLIDALLDFFGTQILNNELKEFLEDEGIM